MDLTDIYKVFHLTTANMHSSQQFMELSKIDNLLEHKASLRKYKKAEVTPCILLDYNVIKIEFNSKETIKYSNTWRRQF
jgi:hypothetical protein